MISQRSFSNGLHIEIKVFGAHDDIRSSVTGKNNVEFQYLKVILVRSSIFFF